MSYKAQEDARLLVVRAEIGAPHDRPREHALLVQARVGKGGEARDSERVSHLISEGVPQEGRHIEHSTIDQSLELVGNGVAWTAMEDCLACELMSGLRELPGGRIHETSAWVVEHCVGPLGVGTLIVKPKRHVLHVWDLDGNEALELGPLLLRTTAALAEALNPEQVYVNLWSHAGGTPVHIHWVIQPVGRDRLQGLIGPHLQSALFDRGELPRTAAIEGVAREVRFLLTR